VSIWLPLSIVHICLCLCATLLLWYGNFQPPRITFCVKATCLQCIGSRLLSSFLNSYEILLMLLHDLIDLQQSGTQSTLEIERELTPLSPIIYNQYKLLTYWKHFRMNCNSIWSCLYQRHWYFITIAYQSRGIHPKIKMHYFEYRRVVCKICLSCVFILDYPTIYLQFQNVCDNSRVKDFKVYYLSINNL
jgi:hypothetical protein